MLPARSILICFLVAASLAPSAYADEVHLRNGDRLSGTLKTMDGTTLVLETTYAGEVRIAWSEVARLRTDTEVEIMLTDGTVLEGRLVSGEDGDLRVEAEANVESKPFPTNKLAHVNPPPEVSGRGLAVKGRIATGLTVNTGNTDSKRLYAEAELVMRGARNRLTTAGHVTREEDQGRTSASHWTARAKYDHFLNHEWYAFTNARFAHDRFQDLDLRTALGAGLGYQFVESEAANLSLEAGLNYVNEDFAVAADQDFLAGRWAVDYDQWLWDNALQLFHRHEGLVSLKDTGDTVITSQTGLRLPLTHGFDATAQVNLDWDNSPAPGADATDATYLLNLGYGF